MYLMQNHITCENAPIALKQKHNLWFIQGIKNKQQRDVSNMPAYYDKTNKLTQL